MRAWKGRITIAYDDSEIPWEMLVVALQCWSSDFPFGCIAGRKALSDEGYQASLKERSRGSPVLELERIMLWI